MDLDKVTQDMIQIIKDCGDLFREGYHKADKQINTKVDENDVVTEYDVKINEKILEFLKEEYPDVNIVSEECDTVENGHEYTFYIDPIDGTRNFTRGIPMCHIGIGLAKGKHVVACATYNPVLDKMYHAIKGKGAFENNKQIRVNKTKISQADVYLNSGEIAIKLFGPISKKAVLVKFEWCSHHTISLVASGRAEVEINYWDKLWDVCHYLLVEEAGGRITDTNGEEYDLDKPGYIASNGAVHDEIVQIIKEAE